MHKLLGRQIRRFFGGPDGLPDGMADFLEAVASAYADADADRLSIERALDLMSNELTESNAHLRNQLRDREHIEEALRTEKAEQEALIKKLEEAHHQLLQSEKMASIGQLAAGVAHEINNPIGFVSSNLGSMRHYVGSMLAFMDAVEMIEPELSETVQARIADVKEKLDLKYLGEDALSLLEESADGIRRVKQIVQDLKDFSHIEEAQWQQSDLHAGLESTLNIVNSQIKYVADVVKEYGPIPQIECLPSQLNQIFLNMLVNASQAIKGHRGTITIRTGMENDDAIFVEFSDNGEGILPENMSRIYDPFFTTKPIGTGTGLGLSLSYGIIKKHGGHIELRSVVGVGTCFHIVLPVTQPCEVIAEAQSVPVSASSALRTHAPAG